MKTRREEFHFLWYNGEFASFGSGRMTLDTNNISSLNLGYISIKTVVRFISLQVSHDLELDAFTLKDVKDQF